MPTTVSDHVADLDALRAAGLRPIQIWVPDTTRSGFTEECRRQSAVVATADRADRDLTDIMDASLRDMERPVQRRRNHHSSPTLQHPGRCSAYPCTDGTFARERPAQAVAGDGRQGHDRQKRDAERPLW